MSSQFNKTYDLILEGIFEPASDEEVKERQKSYSYIMSKEWLEDFLKRPDIHKNEDGSYDVDGDVIIKNLHLSKFPVKFNHVKKRFYCMQNNLADLKDAPKKVDGNFACNDNKLTSLEGGPTHVGGFYWCTNNKLTDLKGAPVIVDGDFRCRFNQIESLDGMPKKIGNRLMIQENPISLNLSFEGIRELKKEIHKISDVKGTIEIGYHVKLPPTILGAPSSGAR